MPPRTVKRGAAAAGCKRTARATRGTRKAQNQAQPDVPDESLMAEVAAPVAESREELRVEEIQEEPTVEEETLVVVEEEDPVVEDKPIAVERPGFEVDHNSHQNGFKKQDKAKDAIDDYEKDERLELEDNDPEYEPEEYMGVDYDDKEIEQEDAQEAEDEGDEEPEENFGEEEGDIVEEEMEDVHEELEGEEYEEHAGEEHEHENEQHEHAQMVDADEEEHHEVVKERRKRKEFEIFVGGLDKDADEADLRKAFAVVGEVTEVRLMMNPLTKKNKGFAFLRFATVEQAKRAVRELKHPVINGKQCGVTPSQDSDTLFLGNICKTWSKEADHFIILNLAIARIG